ncbi:TRANSMEMBRANE PROTEIN [Salix koriyanagi]|uniref:TRANSMEMBRANE PROTEIN n=1 Tax=Salix koriyanagi TaxID=2511006 RepID=A0A9Q0Q807_9ROSI|nr:TRANSMEMBRANE PROTEIN [Salix koriyanagi]
MQTDFQVLVQDVDKLKIHRTTSAPSEMMPSEERGAQGKQVVRRDDMITRKISLLGATTMNEKDTEALPKQEEGTKGAASGNKVIVSSQADLQQASKIIEGKGRSMLGSAAKDTEEAVRSEENDIAEDVAVMDYAQPHRKPPIHNEKS